MSLISKKANTAAELATSADNLLKVFKNMFLVCPE